MSEENSEQVSVDETPDAAQSVDQNAPSEDDNGVTAEHEALHLEPELPDGDTAETAVPSELEQLEAALAVAEADAKEWRDQAHRKAADLQNFRKRAKREAQDARKFAVESLLKELLELGDNFERALEHAADDDPLASGVQMVQRKYYAIMEKHGAAPFEAKGKPFDPQMHEAMSQVENADYPPNTVIEEFVRGWNLHDRLIRPAMVIVSTAPAQPEAADADEAADEAADGGADDEAEDAAVESKAEEADGASEASDGPQDGSD